MAEGRIGEDHEAVMVVASGQMGAMSKGRAKWKGVGKAHVDRVVKLEMVGGYNISLVSNYQDSQDIILEQFNDYTLKFATPEELQD